MQCRKNDLRRRLTSSSPKTTARTGHDTDAGGLLLIVLFWLLLSLQGNMR